MEAEQKNRVKRVRIRKWEGDDTYSWAMFVDGRVIYSGMSKSEAEWRRRRFIDEGETWK